MGLFSFVGKAIKGVAKIATGALKIGGALGIVPGGGLVGKLAGTLLGAKQPMGTTALKYNIRSPQIMRGNATQAMPRYQTPGYRPSPAVLRLSPVLPGGAIATASGPAPRTASPPATFGGRAAASPKKRRRTKAKKRASSRRRSTGRKLKFGSPAWRKKYMKRRRRRAA